MKTENDDAMKYSIKFTTDFLRKNGFKFTNLNSLLQNIIH